MEVILKEDVKGLGYKSDVVKVKPGYARNFLLPRGLALLATPSNKKMIEETLKQQAQKLAKIKQTALDLAASIGELTIEIKAKAGENGKLFGSVNSIHVAEELKSRGFSIDRRDIVLNDIKTLGVFTAKIDLHREVKHEVKVSVVAAE